jgi:diphosphomevalonate decarboxylase
MSSATALAHPNIAFVKYWGNRDDRLILPANGSLSMNLDGMFTRTSVTWLEAGDGGDSLTINGAAARKAALERVSAFLDLVRELAGFERAAAVTSESNFPEGAGIASSASAFAALALAASRAAGLELSEAEHSRLARRGSGSACRSVPGGFVEWAAGSGDANSYAFTIAPPGHWDLVDCLAVISKAHKSTVSSQGQTLAGTSPFQAARLADAPRRLDSCRRALLRRDFEGLAEVVELDSNMMHAVMMTSRPSLFYWQAATLTVMQSVREARAGGLPVCYTIDAGPNVHVLTEAASAQQAAAMLGELPGVREVRKSGVGGPAEFVEAS